MKKLVYLTIAALLLLCSCTTRVKPQTDISEKYYYMPIEVTFDSGNHYIVEDVVEAYRKLAPHIVHVHFKDWERLDAPGEKSLLMGDGKYYRMVPLGEGIVDNYNCLKTMVEAGDKHYFDLEYNGVTPPLEGIRKSWKHLEKCCTAAGGSL